MNLQGDINFSDSTTAYALLKNDSEYLLIEAVSIEKKWRVAFAPDETDVLWYLASKRQSWPSIFPPIREAHRQAHPARKPDDPNVSYLEDFMTDALLNVSTDLNAFLESRMNEIVAEAPAQEAGKNL